MKKHTKQFYAPFTCHIVKNYVKSLYRTGCKGIVWFDWHDHWTVIFYR